MEISGNIVQVLPLQSGEGKNGPWKKQDFVIETEGTYPKKVCLSMWGDKINENLITVGTTLTASIEIESREYNGRWYTDVKAWKLEGQATSAPSAAPASAPAAEIPAALEGEDDLPF
ncbi:DUF3127 domain-containing protein [Arcticibacterium luteifluviistationis]|uniref:DUF3127 domain-containing protein n=1 Tax=Arcticibacterium luteifluviistationis TaxID=1784714 RepID=A0A2Z4GFM5_9BACT|nr:DUF3127 domain-containing protein [Arcticibacterium luteifluviistationis]AWW00190.1 hypothetical protein DJ013_19245 [Arcticibacterium luteifluviistationis]